MTQDTQLAVRQEMTLADTMTLGQTLAASGFFSDAKQAAQAVAKILAGREMGIAPVAAMTGIFVIQGKVTVGAGILAALVKRSGKYDYKVLRLDDEGCELEFSQEGRAVGKSAFNKADAQRAGLLGKATWQQFPRNLYFARALSNGVRWYCPDVASGPVYTPEELGATVDDDGHVIDVPATVVTPIPAPVAVAPPGNDGDGQPKRKPTVAPNVADRWRKGIASLCEEEAYYRDGDRPNWPHVLNAVAAVGFGTVTVDNVDGVIDALRTHAHERAREAEKAAGQLDLLSPDDGELG